MVLEILGQEPINMAELKAELEGVNEPQEIIKTINNYIYEKHRFEYDYDTALDLMVNEGFQITTDTYIYYPTTNNTEIAFLGDEYLLFISAFALISVVGIHRRRN